MSTQSWQRRALLAGLLAGLALAGCRKDRQAKPAPATATPATQAGGGLPRPDLRMESLNRLRQIGLAYQQAAIDGPVAGPRSLGGVQLNDPRGRPYEIVWRVDPGQPAGGGEALLAWEGEADSQGGRCVLRADCSSVEYLGEGRFEKTPRAQPRP
jgi:hypothetical protein